MSDERPEVSPVSALLTGRTGLLVRLSCRPGVRAAMLDMLHRYADGLGQEPGTELFVVSVDPDDADVVWLYEVFRDDAAQLAHRAAEGFATMLAEMPELLAQPPGVLRLDPIRMSLQQTVLTDDLSL